MYNMDKMTTVTELSSVDGKEQDIYRFAGLDLCGGFNNHPMIAQNLFDLPSMNQVLEAWREEEAELKQTA